MPMVAGQVEVELGPVQVAEVIDAFVEVFHHRVDVFMCRRHQWLWDKSASAVDRMPLLGSV